MASVIQHDWFNITRITDFEIVPLGDIHLGARACLEKEFLELVKYIADNENVYWIGMGDYCDFIQMSDPRFDPKALAPWIQIEDLNNLSSVQAAKFIEYVKPIARKCLCLVRGNHEDSITKYYEHDIYSTIVNAIKREAELSEKQKLALGYTGWLWLKFHLGKDVHSGTRSVRLNLHHGFTGGKLAGAKALNMQRWVWTHNADACIWGHTHNEMAQSESVEDLDKSGKIINCRKVGMIAGTFLSGTGDGYTTYSERKGYFPIPAGEIPRLLLQVTPNKPRVKVKVLI